jgi:para-nitrobenzyl esterase
VLRGAVADHGYLAVAAYGLPLEKGLAAYRAMYPDASPGVLLGMIETDWYCRIPGIRLADAHAAADGRAGTWMYEFAWPSPAFGGALGSCHALEIPFVFDTLDSAVMFTGDAPERRDIADAMHAAWIAFARSGDPNTDGVPTWPAYDRERRVTMRFDVKPEVVDDPMGDDRAAWGDFRR